jgi:hypothetical protein
MPNVEKTRAEFDSNVNALLEESDDFAPSLEKFDSTGLFHWVKERAYDDALLVRSSYSSCIRL